MATIEQTREAMHRFVHPDGKPNLNRIAAELGVARSTIQGHIATIRTGDSHGKPPPFRVINQLTDKERSIDELIRHRREEGRRARAYETDRSMMSVAVETPGPVGIMVFGDPHIDSPGCDFELLESHLQLAAERPDYVFAGNIGDVRDGWIGRLSRLYSQTTVTAKEGWRLVEWMFKGAGVHWLFLIRGNHDLWCGDNDPLDWIARDSVCVDQSSGARISILHPNGAETRLHARHDFSGHSIYNKIHGLKKELLHGERDHVVIAGHRHEGADAGDFIAGMSVQMVRLSAYKISDSYQHEKGFQKSPLHPAALIIIDSDEPDSSRSRAWCAPTVEEGIAYLDWKREQFNRRAGSAEMRASPTSPLHKPRRRHL